MNPGMTKQGAQKKPILETTVVGHLLQACCLYGKPVNLQQVFSQVPDSRLNQGDWSKIEDAAATIGFDPLTGDKIVCDNILPYIVKWDVSKTYTARTETEKAAYSKWSNKIRTWHYLAQAGFVPSWADSKVPKERKVNTSEHEFM